MPHTRAYIYTHSLLVLIIAKVFHVITILYVSSWFTTCTRLWKQSWWPIQCFKPTTDESSIIVWKNVSYENSVLWINLNSETAQNQPHPIYLKRMLRTNPPALSTINFNLMPSSYLGLSTSAKSPLCQLGWFIGSFDYEGGVWKNVSPSTLIY